MPTQHRQSGLDTLADVSCGNIYSGYEGYEEHLLPRDGCGLPTTSDSRQGHHVTANGAKSWECADCGMTFPQSKLLATHARNTKHKAYRCSRDPTCTKVFGMRTAASRHEAKHSASMNHACSQCGKRFRRRDHCLQHEEICSSLSVPTSRREPTLTSGSGARAPVSARNSGEEFTTNPDTFASTSAAKDSRPCVDITTPDRSSLRYNIGDNNLEQSHPTHLNDIQDIQRIPSDTTSKMASIRELPVTSYVSMESQQFDDSHRTPITPPHPGVAFTKADGPDKTQSATHLYALSCYRCDQHFIFPFELQDHIRERHPAGPAQTSQQDRDDTFSRSSVAPEHSQKSSRTFRCNLCPKRFKRSWTLREHFRTHTWDRAFECNVCGRAFVRKQERERHEASHRIERNFACHGTLESGAVWGCGRKFSRAEALNRHFKSKAGQSCLKPILDEVAAKRKEASLEAPERAQADISSGPSAVQSHTNAPFVLPAPLLQQYPALAGLDWSSLFTRDGEKAYDASSLLTSF